ncbi:ATP12 family chaperone protein [Shimia biformata]|uniref:ATP12 family chaperone protein n=1 Tax=Shimia biformata TaxID=1294299 RepID=UPI00194E3E70|nr:ATP12 family protein [Shimia biformata]
MSGWAKKKFWKQAEVIEVDGGFGITLDGRSVKTPAKAALVMPTRAMAEAAAQEWQAQDQEIDPTTMPVTRSANAAIDKVSIQHTEVADMLAEYGNSDLLCYRAAQPDELIQRQAAAWDPLLDWARTEFGVQLKAVSGVMHVAQDEHALAILRDEVHALDLFRLAAFHDLVSLSGSLIIGFAAARQAQPIDALWSASRIDETWQEEQWGEDEEATELAKTRYNAFLHADFFFRMC